MTDIQIAALPAGRLDDMYRAVEIAFGGQDRPEAEEEKELIEDDRALAAFEGDDIVGGIGAFTFEMTTPGGIAPTAGVTWAGVLPTHRRRGILRALISRQLADVHERQEPIAALWASESSIYGRYGYGAAIHEMRWSIERAHTRFKNQLGDELRRPVRLYPRDDAWAPLETVWEQVRRSRPGFVKRTSGHWKHQFQTPPEPDDMNPEFFFVVSEGVDGPAGYAAYQLIAVDPDLEIEGLPNGRVVVRELVATNPDAHADLWRYIFGIDLTKEIVAIRRPAEEPLIALLADGRRVQGRLTDAIWIRIVDLPNALAVRTYSTTDELTLRVVDALCPWNDGTWSVTLGPDGAGCESTTAAPDLSVEVGALGAVYMGGTPLRMLHAAGLVDEHTPGAVHRLDLAFAAPTAPWSPHMF